MDLTPTSAAPSATAPSDSGAVRAVKRLYQALQDRDMATVRELLSPEPVWDITEGAPDGGVYRGYSEVFGGFYAQLGARYPRFTVDPQLFVGSPHRVVAAGVYHLAECADEDTRPVRFAHIFGLDPDGRITGVWQVADTALLV